MVVGGGETEKSQWYYLGEQDANLQLPVLLRS